MMIFSYVMKTNVITVGNYLNGFSIQSMKNYFHTINPHLEVSDEGFIAEHPQIHIFFHIHKNPLVGASSGNHFGYLQPLSSCTLHFDKNTIKEVGVRTTQKQPTLNEWCKSYTIHVRQHKGNQHWIIGVKHGIGLITKEFLLQRKMSEEDMVAVPAAAGGRA